VLWEINLGSPVSGFPISFAVNALEGAGAVAAVLQMLLQGLQ